MPASIATHPRYPIALLGVGPNAHALLEPFFSRKSQDVHLLSPSEDVFDQVFRKVELLILVLNQASEEDSQAALTLARQVQHTGFGVHTLCVVVRAATHSGGKHCAFAHYTAQALQAHADALVTLPGDADIDMQLWLTQSVGDMVHSLSGRASVGMCIEEITRLIQNTGAAAWASSHASGIDRASKVVQKLWQHPFLVSVDLASACGVAVWISASPQALKLSESRNIMLELCQRISPAATVLYSSLFDARLGEKLRVNVFWAGVKPVSPPRP